MKNKRLSYMVRLALLLSITIILAATPLGYIPAGVLSFTIMVLPVAVGGVLLGLPAGVILGLAFGITSLLKAPTEALGILLLEESPFLTVIICILPRVMVGVCAGFAGKFLAKKDRPKFWQLTLTGAVCSFVNTALFVGLVYFCCHGIVENAFGAAVWGTTLLGGAVEIVANAFLTGVIVTGLKKVLK